MTQNVDAERLAVPRHGNVEIGPESSHISQLHRRPRFWESWGHREGAESRRADAEESFSIDAAVNGAFGGEMSLVAFGPCLYWIWDVLTEKPPRGIPAKEIHCTLRLACSQHTTQRV